jgi:protein SCO1/2
MALPRTLCVSVLLGLAGGATLYGATDRLQAFTTESARRVAVRQHPMEIPAVALETQSGERINLATMRGRWLLVDFIYTRCPTYCRALGSEFAQLQDRLAGPLAQDKVRLVSISFDPEHDTPEELASYLRRSRNRGPGWIAARPLSAQDLARLTQAFGITVIADGAGGYVHNTAIHVVDPQGRLVQIIDAAEPDRAGRTVTQRLGR